MRIQGNFCSAEFCHTKGFVSNSSYSLPGPSCSKLTMSLVNDSLKFTPSDT